MKNQRKNSILVILAIFLLQTASYAQSMRKNAIGTRLGFGPNKAGLHLDYQRSITKHFSLVGSFGERSYKNEFQTLKSGEITGRIMDIGLGGQFNQHENGHGFFFEGGLNLSRSKWYAKGKSELPDSGFRPSSIGGAILGLLLSIDNYYYLSGSSESWSVVPYGRVGYRFMGKKERLSFSPFLMLEGAPGKNVLELTSSVHDKVVNINPKNDIMPVSFGLQSSLRF